MSYLEPYEIVLSMRTPLLLGNKLRLPWVFHGVTAGIGAPVATRQEWNTSLERTHRWSSSRASLGPSWPVSRAPVPSGFKSSMATRMGYPWLPYGRAWHLTTYCFCLVWNSPYPWKWVSKESQEWVVCWVLLVLMLSWFGHSKVWQLVTSVQCSIWGPSIARVGSQSINRTGVIWALQVSLYCSFIT